jgi:hypothetical protein
MDRLMKTLLLFLALSVPLHAQSILAPIVASSTNTATVSNPTIFPATGYSGGATSVTITQGAIPSTGQTIFYCTVSSGSCTPTTTYTGPLSFTATENIFYFASAAGYTSSPTLEWSGTFVPLPAILQSNFTTADCTGSTCATTLTNHTAGGMTCVASEATSASAPTGISNTAGFTWNTVSGSGQGATAFFIWWACATKSSFTGTDTFTVTRSGTFHGGVAVFDISNVSAVNTQASQFTQTGGNAPSVTLTPTGPYNMVLFIATYVSTPTFGPSAGYTCVTCSATNSPWNNGGAGNSLALVAYQQTAGSSVTASLAQTHGTNAGIFAIALQ